METIVWLLEQIRKTKTAILYSILSYRGYVVALRLLSSHIENRVSDVLCRFLDTLITTSRKDTEQDLESIQEHTDLKKSTDLRKMVSVLGKLGDNADLCEEVNLCPNTNVTGLYFILPTCTGVPFHVGAL